MTNEEIIKRYDIERIVKEIIDSVYDQPERYNYDDSLIDKLMEV